MNNICEYNTEKSILNKNLIFKHLYIIFIHSINSINNTGIILIYILNSQELLI